MKKEKIKNLISIRDKTKDVMIKICTSILLEDQSGFNIYYDSINDEQKEILKSYPIINLKK